MIETALGLLPWALLAALLYWGIFKGGFPRRIR